MSVVKKCGFVALMGATNAGKSTLINHFIRRKVAIVSRKIQTTRMYIRGITTVGDTQLIFVDTPGLFTPRHRLDRAMVGAAFDQGRQADKIVFLLDAQKQMSEESESQFMTLSSLSPEKILLINKIDLVNKDNLLALTQSITEKNNFSQVFFISALTGEGCDEVLEFLANSMPVGEHLYPEGQTSDLPDALMAAEITREKILNRLHQEIPYGIHVESESFVENKDKSITLRQIIYIGRQSHKKIVLGKGGETIKAISTSSRLELEKLFKRKVHLFLYVKLHENWMEDRGVYQSMRLDYDAQDE